MTNPADAIRLESARDLFPGRPHASTLRRWSAVGVLAPTGVRVRLQTTRLGGRRFTTREWAAEFIRQCETKIDLIGDDATPLNTGRADRADEARKQLAAMGFYK